MKLLFDFLPIALFFGVFKYAGKNAEWAASFASQYLGFIVAGGIVSPTEAPVLLATVVVVLATALQILYLAVKKQKIDTMLWISFGLVLVLGGATIYFHNADFIKWKPTGLYWAAGMGLILAHVFFKKNGIKALMGKQINLPEPVWTRLNFIWAVFFAFMGFANIYVAYNFSTDIWVNFKLFGLMGLMLVFVIGQGVYLSRYMTEDKKVN